MEIPKLKDQKDSIEQIIADILNIPPSDVTLVTDDVDETTGCNVILQIPQDSNPRATFDKELQEELRKIKPIRRIKIEECEEIPQGEGTVGERESAKQICSSKKNLKNGF